MSDERDSAGSAGDDTDTEATGKSRGQTAVANRPLRPSGKRSRRGAVADGRRRHDDRDQVGRHQERLRTPRVAKKTGEPGKARRNPFAFVWNYLKQVVAELRKVIWPNRKQMVSYTTVVLVFLAFMVALIAGGRLRLGPVDFAGVRLTRVNEEGLTTVTTFDGETPSGETVDAGATGPTSIESEDVATRATGAGGREPGELIDEASGSRETTRLPTRPLPTRPLSKRLRKKRTSTLPSRSRKSCASSPGTGTSSTPTPAMRTR